MAIKKKTIIPLGDKVLVELIEVTKSEGGLDLPEKVVKSGIVKAIGLGVPEIFTAEKDKEKATRGIKVGDKVFLPRGATVGDVFLDEENKKLLLVPISYVGAIIED